MLYTAYEARRRPSGPDLRSPGCSPRRCALPQPIAETARCARSRAIADTVRALQLTHRRPAFGIDAVEIAGERIASRRKSSSSTPFGTLLHFTKDGDWGQPRVLVVPGLAGHYGTLVRGTVRTLLPDHDV